MDTARLDEWAAKYKEANEKSKKYAETARRYRARLQKWLVDKDRQEVTTPYWKIRRNVFLRASMVKKETPPEIWKQYAISRRQEMLVIRPQKGSGIVGRTSPARS